MTDLREKETWLPVSGFEGRYEISDMGRIRSLTFRDAWGHESAREVPLMLRPSGDPYYRIGLSVNGKRIYHSVHRLVLTAFRGLPEKEGQNGAHLNGDSHYNKLSNLAWVSVKENAAHKLIHGTRARGESQGIAKLTDDAVRDIRTRYSKGQGGLLAAQYGVAVTTVCDVAHGRSWRHV